MSHSVRLRRSIRLSFFILHRHRQSGSAQTDTSSGLLLRSVPFVSQFESNRTVERRARALNRARDRKNQRKTSVGRTDGRKADFSSRDAYRHDERWGRLFAALHRGTSADCNRGLAFLSLFQMSISEYQRGGTTVTTRSQVNNGWFAPPIS